MFLLTADRPRMLRNALELYAAAAPGLTVLVSDTSSGDAQRLNREAAAEYASFVSYQPFSPGSGRHEQYLHLVEQCQTPYLVVAPDGDVLIPDGLRESMLVLKTRPECSAAHGISYTLAPHETTGDFRLAITGGFIGRSYDSSSALSRLMALFFWYQSPYHAVRRLDDFRHAIALQSAVSGPLREMYLAGMTVISGKAVRLRVPYAIRRVQPTIGDAPLSEFSAAFMSGGAAFLDEYQPVRTALATALAGSMATERDWTRLVDIAFAGHIRRNWRAANAWRALAATGDIPESDVAELSVSGIESETFDIPAPELRGYIQPLLDKGWPSFG
jgi:glycosyltransferase domain-containing protein